MKFKNVVLLLFLVITLSSCFYRGGNHGNYSNQPVGSFERHRG